MSSTSKVLTQSLWYSLRYGFVTFAEASCAYEAIEKFSKDPLISKYDIRFGGRRKFCKQTYADLGKHFLPQVTCVVLSSLNFFLCLSLFRLNSRLSRESKVFERLVVRRALEDGKEKDHQQEIALGNLNPLFEIKIIELTKLSKQRKKYFFNYVVSNKNHSGN